MDLGLHDKHAIVTGGSRGIGKAIAREFAREGADVAIVARNKADLEATARELAAETNRRIVPLAADVTSKEQVDRMVAEAAQQLGGDVLSLAYLLLSSDRLRILAGRWIFRPLEICGRHSLEVFAVGCVAALLGRLLFRTYGAGIEAQIAINVVGIAMMCMLGLWLEKRRRPAPPFVLATD